MGLTKPSPRFSHLLGLGIRPLPKGEGCVVVLGTFDGVHLGHQRIIKDAVSFAKRHGLKSVITTFDPHPQQYLVPKRGLKLLTTLDERKKIFKSLGADKIKVFKFNKRFCKLSGEEFIVKYIVRGLKASFVFVGYDYVFGHNRGENVNKLRKLGKKYGFVVKMVKPLCADSVPVKSSTIRDFINKGKFNKAVRFLGRPYTLSGKVVAGVGRGKELGFPTANLLMDPYKLLPVYGVYAGIVNKRKCLVNIGLRPTFKHDQVSVEVFIPHFHGNLYGKYLEVYLYKRLRNEIKFPDAEELKGQIKKDVRRLLTETYK